MLSAEEYLNSMEGIHPELYEEEYRRTMKSISWALHFMDEFSLGYQVDRKLKEHVEEQHQFKAETLEMIHRRGDSDYPSRWVKYLKSIPKRGLNNMTKKPRGIEHFNSVPTLPQRLKNICVSGFFGLPQLPFFYYHMEIRTNLLTGHRPGLYIGTIKEIRELTIQIIERLEELYDNMDTVTVLPESDLNYWKGAIRGTILYIRMKSGWVGLKLIQEAGHKMLESTPSAPLIEETKEESK